MKIEDMTEGEILDISTQHRLGQAQRCIERKVNDINEDDPREFEKAVISLVLKTSQQYILPYKCFEMLERWAIREYINKGE